MCGICGYTGGADEGVLRAMRDSLAHRGPDEAGEAFAPGLALGHRRLAIVDIAGGQQPFVSSDGSVVVVFNGEIYNHPALRQRLQRRGHTYATSCDTESIVNAYLEYGTACVEHLDGMFAFVLHDRRANRLFGARDRFGKKPFYYSLPAAGGRRSFVFGSELRALLAHPDVRREAVLSEDAVKLFLLHDYVPGPHSIFANVRKLEAGHAFSLELDEPVPAELPCWQYWRNPIDGPARETILEPEAAEEFLRLLSASVERRLMSDVPLGVFLSGGIDSSTIVALLSRLVPPAEIETFSIGFDESSFDESAYALAAAERFGTRHRSRTFSAADCRKELAGTLSRLDEPLADPSILPTSMLCRFARERVTVALGGDGGDELLAGYDPFAALGPARLYASLVPRTVDTNVVAGLAGLLPASEGNMSLGFRVHRFLRGAKQPPALRLPLWMGALSPAQLAALLPGSEAGTIASAGFAAEIAQDARVRAAGGDDVQAALSYFQHFYLVDDILVKADRASMLHSLEVRAPFLDTALAEFVNRLPSGLKWCRGRGKHLLRQALLTDGGAVPSMILDRRKKGFGIPVARWIRHELASEFRTKLVDEWPDGLGMLDVRAIRRLHAAHVAGRENNYKELWALYVLGEWARHWAP